MKNKKIIETTNEKYKFVINDNDKSHQNIVMKIIYKSKYENEGIVIFEDELENFYGVFEEMYNFLIKQGNCTEHLSWKEIKKKIYKRDEYECKICGENVNDKGQVHHLIEKSEGVSNCDSNLITICGKCHMLISVPPDYAIYNAFRIPKEKIGYERYKAKETEKQIKNNMLKSEAILKEENFETDNEIYHFKVKKTVGKRFILVINQESKYYNNHDLRRVVIYKEDIDKINSFFQKLINNQKAYSVEKIRKNHPNAYKKWSKDEEEYLLEKYKNGMKINNIAKELGRQVGAIRSKIKKLT